MHGRGLRAAPREDDSGGDDIALVGSDVVGNWAVAVVRTMTSGGRSRAVRVHLRRVDAQWRIALFDDLAKERSLLSVAAYPDEPIPNALVVQLRELMSRGRAG